MVRMACVVVLVGVWATPGAGAPAKGEHHVGFTLLKVSDGAGKELTVAFW